MSKKHLHCMTEENGHIITYFQYNINTNYISIRNSFTNNYYKLKPINKKSSNYLGLTCTEQVLEKIFKNVIRMPYGHKGYDFECSNGFLIDSKASCVSKGKYNNWLFRIKQNKVADYFALLAFDNRDDMNPIYFWLIPGNVINDKMSLTISKSTLSKWDEYRQNISKFIKCCNNLKGDINENTAISSILY